MPAKVICMASAKGGSGKTVLTATFAEFLSKLGKRVLCVDVDAATTGLTLLYSKEVMFQGEFAMGEKRHPKGIFDIQHSDGLAENGKFPGELVILANGVTLFPATYHFKNTENCTIENYRSTLFLLLGFFDDEFDFIFLDAQAGMDPFAAIAMSRDVSNDVVIVSEYDPMSAAGVERLKAMFREDLTYPRTWILLNKMLPEFVQSFSDFLQVANYISPIPWDSEVVLAYARRRLALDMDAGNGYTLAVIKTTKSLLGELISREVAEWLENKTAEILRPLEEQFLDKERTLLQIRQEKVFRRRDQLRSLTKAATFFFLGLIGLTLSVFYIQRLFRNTTQFIDIAVVDWFSVGSTAAVALIFIFQFLRLYSGLTDKFSIRMTELDRREEVIAKEVDKLKEKIDSDIEELLRK